MPGDGKDRAGRFGGSLIRGKSQSLREVPAALPDEDDRPAEPVAPEPAAASALNPEPDDAPRPRSRRRAPQNVRLHGSVSAQFWESYLDAKQLDLDLTVIDHASRLMSAALRAERRRKGS